MERVLVVEDDQDVRDLLIETLESWGYEPVAAENGKMGLEKFESSSFSLIITDIRMPVMDGVNMLKAIREKNSRIPIIVITGYPSVDSAVESLEEGADYYIVKPIKLDDLRAKVHKSFERHEILEALVTSKSVGIALALSIPLWILLGLFLSRLIW